VRTALDKAVGVEDLRRLARRRLPRALFQFVDDGSEGETTLRENRRAFDSVGLRARNATWSPARDLATTVLGSQLAFPVMIAPTGATRFVHPDGELAMTRAVDKAGTVYVYPHGAGHPMEAIDAVAAQPMWYQLYHYGGRDVVEAALERIRRCRFSVLVLTVDSAGHPRLETSLRNGLTELATGGIANLVSQLPQLMARPGWVLNNLRDGYRSQMPNIVRPDGSIITHMDIYAGRQPPAPAFTWDDIGWLRERFKGPIVLKGIVTGEDTRRAVDLGIAGVIVSNHGGRMLDGAPATLHALPEVVAAADGRLEVLLDSGIRRGSDAVKALALGARAVLVGRAALYGLAAGGEAGVSRVLSMLRSDIDRALTFMGCKSVHGLDPSWVNLPKDWPTP
jgi:isopentenyl diphosphate isomerase/L-lactate dehydrogenase-like FMN-dependent dehydrogenase